MCVYIYIYTHIYISLSLYIYIYIERYIHTHKSITIYRSPGALAAQPAPIARAPPAAPHPQHSCPVCQPNRQTSIRTEKERPGANR